MDLLNESAYIGEFVDGLRQGKGLLKRRNNQISYFGEFHGGLEHGYGHIEGLNGQRKCSYKGDYEEGKAHGKGEMMLLGNYYIGNLKRGKR